jgi:RNA polymerase sigma factor (TIGR02999 family)
MPLVYEELVRLARREKRRGVESRALAHEVFLRLRHGIDVDFVDRGHFYAIAARLVRNVAVDQARKSAAAKRGGRSEHVELTGFSGRPAGGGARDRELVALDSALTDLHRMDEHLAQVVELRFFGGFSVEETADALGVSSNKVKRDWALAKSWMYQHISGGAPAAADTATSTVTG